MEAAVPPELADLLVECQPADGSWRPRFVNVSDVSLSIAFWDDAYDAVYQGSSAGDDAWTSDVLAKTGAGYTELYHWEGSREVGVSMLPAGDALSLTYTGIADGGDHLVTVAPDTAHTRAAFAVRTVSEVFDRIPWGDLGMDRVRWSHTVGCAGSAAAAMKDDYALTLDEAVDVSEPCREAVDEIHERYEARRQAAARRAPAQRIPPAVTPEDLHGRVTSAARPAQTALDDAGVLLLKGAVVLGSRGRARP